jgi:hypothetical protein
VKLEIEFGNGPKIEQDFKKDKLSLEAVLAPTLHQK